MIFPILVFSMCLIEPSLGYVMGLPTSQMGQILPQTQNEFQFDKWRKFSTNREHKNTLFDSEVSPSMGLLNLGLQKMMNFAVLV